MKEDFLNRLRICCQIIGVDYFTVLDNKRVENVKAKSMAVYWMRKSYPTIEAKLLADFLGYKDHTPVLNLLKNMEEDIYGVLKLIPRENPNLFAMNLTYDFNPIYEMKTK